MMMTKKRTRYNPMRDPGFDLNAPEFVNHDRRNSAFSKSELQHFDQAMRMKKNTKLIQ